MSQVSSNSSRFLVIVQPKGAVVQTIEYALREARDLQAEFEEPVFVDIRIITPESSIESGTKGQIERTIAKFGLGEEIQTNVGSLALPGNTSVRRTGSLLSRIDKQDISRLILSAEIDLSVEQLREKLGVTTVELAPGTTLHQRRRLLHPGGLRRLGGIFGITYLFYLAIGGFAGGLDFLTGAISASVVALALSQIALNEEPELRRTGWRLVRMAIFLPALIWEIVKANFVIAYIILHPRVPIDPSMEVIETDTHEGLERMVLANSITLTPGTLTIDVRGRAFRIHSLTAQSRNDLLGGRLQRLVAWVFYGSKLNRIEKDERGDDK